MDTTIDSQKILKNMELEIAAADSLGLRNMPWKASSDSVMFPEVIDVNWLTEQEQLPILASIIPAHLLYRSIIAHGIEDSIEVIEWIRGKQLIKILDYDIWNYEKEQETEDICDAKVIQWFQCWLAVGSEFAATRVFELEEETLILIFSKIFDIQPDGIGTVDYKENDDYWLTPDSKFLIKVKDQKQDTFEIVKQIVDALFAKNFKLASSVFAYSAMLVRNESLEDAQRWRLGRMSDEGFVPREEALSCLHYKGTKHVWDTINYALQQQQERLINIPIEGEDNSDIAENIMQLLCGLEPDAAADLIKSSLPSDSVRKLLGVENASLITVSSDLLLDDVDAVNAGIDSLISKAQDLWIKALSFKAREFKEHRLLLERVFAKVSEQHKGSAFVGIKERMARLTNLFISGTNLQNDEDALTRGVMIVRGATNIGLESLIKEQKNCAFLVKERLDELTEEQQAIIILEKLGPEYLFQLGWNTILDISYNCAISVEKKSSTLKNKSLLDIAVLVKNEQFASVRKKLREFSIESSQIFAHIIESFINRVPLFPELLLQNDIKATKANTARRAFETLNDINLANDFIANIKNLSSEVEF